MCCSIDIQQLKKGCQMNPNDARYPSLRNRPEFETMGIFWSQDKTLVDYVYFCNKRLYNYYTNYISNIHIYIYTYVYTGHYGSAAYGSTLPTPPALLWLNSAKFGPRKRRTSSYCTCIAYLPTSSIKIHLSSRWIWIFPPVLFAPFWERCPGVDR